VVDAAYKAMVTRSAQPIDARLVKAFVTSS
jgi:hypothetical protein